MEIMAGQSHARPVLFTVDKTKELEFKDKYYARNYLSFMAEGFLYAFAYNLFSTSNVLPGYAATLTDNAVLLSLLSVLYYGPMYISSIFSVLFSMNSASPQKMGVLVCLSQRVGLLLITVSSFLIGRVSQPLVIAFFFFAFTFMNVSDGISSPIYFNMTGSMIHKNVGQFFGNYSMIGSVAGVLGSLLLSYLFGAKGYPDNYRLMFSVGVVFALGATGAILFGTKEYPDRRPVGKRVHIQDLPELFRDCFRDNPGFRNYTLIYVILGAADFTMPFYILRLAEKGGIASNVGVMSFVNLASGIIANWVFGKIADRKGTFSVLVISTFCGLLAALTAIWNPGGILSILCFILISFATCGSALSNNMACNVYAKGDNTTVCTAASKLLAAPVFIAASLGSGVLAQKTSMTAVFALAFVSYTVGFILSLTRSKRSE